MTREVAVLAYPVRKKAGRLPDQTRPSNPLATADAFKMHYAFA